MTLMYFGRVTRQCFEAHSRRLIDLVLHLPHKFGDCQECQKFAMQQTGNIWYLCHSILVCSRMTHRLVLTTNIAGKEIKE